MSTAGSPETSNQRTRAMAAMDAVEIKVTVRPDRVLRWKLNHNDFPHDLPLEEWRLPDGDDLVEVSIKTSPEDARQVQKEFDAYLRELGLDPEGAQETKTRTALEYFAKTHRETTSQRASH
jgi:hypothetical protein